MSRNTMKGVICTTVFALSLFSAGVCSAHGGGGYSGGHGGYYGGHGGYYGGHGGYYGGHGGYYSGHGGYYGGWIGPGYYAYPTCQNIRVCNAYGSCWFQNSCY